MSSVAERIAMFQKKKAEDGATPSPAHRRSAGSKSRKKSAKAAASPAGATPNGASTPKSKSSKTPRSSIADRIAALNSQAGSPTLGVSPRTRTGPAASPAAADPAPSTLGSGASSKPASAVGAGDAEAGVGSPTKDATGKKKSPRRRSSIADRIAALNQLPGSPGAAAPRAAPSKVASPTTPEAASGAVVDGSQAKAVGSATSQAEPADAAGTAADTATPPADGQDSGATGASTPSQGEPKKKRKSKSARSSRSSAMAARLAALEAAGAPVMGMTPANRKPRTRPMSMPQSSKHHMDAERPRGGSVASLQARLSGLQFGGERKTGSSGDGATEAATPTGESATASQLEATMARPVLRRKKKTKKKLAASALPVGLGDDLGLDFAAPEAPAATNRDSGDVPAPPSVPPQATTPAAANSSDSPVEPPTAP